MIRLLAYLWHLFVTRDHGRLAAGRARSGKWRAVEQAHLRKHPRCAVCGTKKHLNVHHVVPFGLDPSRELAKSNLITLCRDNGCHLLFGHCGGWERFNPTVRADALAFSLKVKLAMKRARFMRRSRLKLKHRPKG